MTTSPHSTRAAANVMAAIEFLSQDHRADRALTIHHPGPGGRCASCGDRYPCFIAVAAQKGAERAERHEARLARLPRFTRGGAA